MDTVPWPSRTSWWCLEAVMRELWTNYTSITQVSWTPGFSSASTHVWSPYHLHEYLHLMCTGCPNRWWVVYPWMPIGKHSRGLEMGVLGIWDCLFWKFSRWPPPMERRRGPLSDAVIWMYFIIYPHPPRHVIMKCIFSVHVWLPSGCDECTRCNLTFRWVEPGQLTWRPGFDVLLFMLYIRALPLIYYMNIILFGYLPSSSSVFIHLLIIVLYCGV